MTKWENEIQHKIYNICKGYMCLDETTDLIKAEIKKAVNETKGGHVLKEEIFQKRGIE